MSIYTNYHSSHITIRSTCRVTPSRGALPVLAIFATVVAVIKGTSVTPIIVCTAIFTFEEGVWIGYWAISNYNITHYII